MGCQLFCQLIKQKDLFNRAKTSKNSCCLCGLFISDDQMPLPIFLNGNMTFLWSLAQDICTFRLLIFQFILFLLFCITWCIHRSLLANIKIFISGWHANLLWWLRILSLWYFHKWILQGLTRKKFAVRKAIFVQNFLEDSRFGSFILIYLAGRRSP